MSYFEDGDTVPAPFNLFPSTKLVYKIFKCGKGKRSTNSIMVSTNVPHPDLSVYFSSKSRSVFSTTISFNS